MIRLSVTLALVVALHGCALHMSGSEARLDDLTSRVRGLEAHAAKVDQWTGDTARDVSAAVTKLEERVGVLEKKK